MYLIVGLGNPGPKYERTRHNVGFMVADRLIADARAVTREKFKGHFARIRIGGEEAIVLTPQTFMNLSGESAQPAMKFFKVSVDRVLVVHDELDLPFGTLRLKKGGGAGGHNGLKSLTRHCGGPDFLRLRIGIGRPAHGRVEGYVLGEFPSSESAELPDVVQEATSMVEAVISDGIDAAMNRLHSRKGR